MHFEVSKVAVIVDIVLQELLLVIKRPAATAEAEIFHVSTVATLALSSQNHHRTKTSESPSTKLKPDP